jgi:hypothetical protein
MAFLLAATALPIACGSARGSGFASSGATHHTVLPSVVRSELAACPPPPSVKYGYSLAEPVRIGGDIQGADRALAFLRVLRGPAGEATEFRRLGTQVSAEVHIVDVYELRYTGLETPLRIFVDQYDFSSPAIPSGLTCAETIYLPPPGPPR